MEQSTVNRFLKAQETVYDVALAEIRSGKKESHWMWYIFPQLRGLGYSPLSYTYGINGMTEAKEYLAHPTLSFRLVEICKALLAHNGKNIYDIMGEIDEMKLQSSMTLFAYISKKESVFHQVINCFYGGCMDEFTLELIENINF